MRAIILAGAIIGSTIGGFVPGLWGGSALSLGGVICSTLGGILGIWAGAKAGANFL